MYKLLLVTDSQEALDAFNAMESWESLGFKKPRVAQNTEQAKDILSRHHVDGIAANLCEGEKQALLSFMETDYPITPLVEAPATPEKWRRNLGELALLLGRIRADYSNDNANEAEMLQLARHDFFRHLLCDHYADEEKIRRLMGLVRSRMNPDSPCVVMRLSTPDEDGYLRSHWKYGPDRLEVAMRNFFGAELQGMRILISLLPDERIYLVACPMLGCKALEREEMLSLMERHAEDVIQHVREYLGIELNISTRQTMPRLVDAGKLLQ